MASTFRLQIVTPDRMFYDDEVEMVVVKTINGEMGILAKHIPIVAPLVIGKVKIKKSGEAKEAALCGGFVQVDKEATRIIVDSAEWPEEIDLKRAEEAKARAEKRLSGDRSNVDIARAEIALKRALNRISVVK